MLGCSGSDAGESLAGPEPVPIAGCTTENYGTCDILASSCPKRILSLMACLRGTKDAELPPITVVSAGEYRELLESIFAEETDEEQAETALFEQGLVLLGLAEPGSFAAASQVDQLAEAVLASYSHIDKSITIVAPEKARGWVDSVANMLTLGHELVHALQDQEHDLDSYTREHSVTYDDYLASRAVPEGEAELLVAFYATALWGLAPDLVPWLWTFRHPAC